MNDLTDTNLMVIQGLINGATFSGKDLEAGVDLKTKINDEIKRRVELKKDESKE